MRRGFTLVEILIVLAVVALLIAVLIQFYKGMQSDAGRARAAGETQVSLPVLAP
ncbi:MAG: type II secretion system GspH family protein [Candidatus Margulisbacteria bacterium]|jgi:prepilin-type N-terminal cleavage/methylation domain-containing protein|nr:type II secretion system GspH family protein [Candidatus Margulisiibacteriota bacterium]